MGLILVVANQKGGVGKTTTTINLAAGLALGGHATLIIDADPQANATMSFLDPFDAGPSLFEIISEPKSAIKEGIAPTAIPNLSIIPARVSLATAERRLADDADGPYRLRDKLEAVRGEFKFVLIDTPPNLGILTVNALVAASHLVIPVQASYFSLEGTEDLLDTVTRIRAGFNNRLAVLGVLVTMRDRRTVLGRDISRKIREMFGDLVFSTEISRSVRLEESPAYKDPIFSFAPRSRPAGEFHALCQEVLNRATKRDIAGKRRGRARRPHRGRPQAAGRRAG